MMSKNTRLVICVISLGDPKGRKIPENSLKLFFEYMKMTEKEMLIHFLDSCIIPDFAEQLEAEVWTDNNLIILENVFFHPEEAGFIQD